MRTKQMWLVFLMQYGNNNNLEVNQRYLKIIIFKTFHELNMTLFLEKLPIDIRLIFIEINILAKHKKFNKKLVSLRFL